VNKYSLFSKSECVAGSQGLISERGKSGKVMLSKLLISGTTRPGTIDKEAV